MAVSEAELKENYRRLSDARLMQLAAERAAVLRPEALVLLKAELAGRGLAEVAEKTIAAQLRVVSEAEITEYCGLLQTQPCPVCRSSTRPLNASMRHKVMSFVVMTTWKKQFAIACPACLDKLNSDASTTSALLGWWGFPWGIIRTIQALAFNGKMAKLHHAPRPNDLLKSFVVENIGRIEAARDSSVDLQALLRATHLN